MTSYTNEDFDSLYQTVRRELIQKANYDIVKDDKYKIMLSDVVMSVREKKKGTSQYINSLVLNSIVPKFTTMINKGKNANAYNPPVNSPVDTLSLPRPDFTRGQNYSIPEQNQPIQTGANIQQQQQNFRGMMVQQAVALQPGQCAICYQQPAQKLQRAVHCPANRHQDIFCRDCWNSFFSINEN